MKILVKRTGKFFVLSTEVDDKVVSMACHNVTLVEALRHFQEKVRLREATTTA